MTPTTKVALVVEYDGTRYHGFQLQASLPTIQSEVEKAVWKLTGEKVRVVSASRTDAGVHAKGQVISLRTTSPFPALTFINGLNYYLPSDIAVKTAYRVSNSFNVRRQAISRQYNYYILNCPTRSPIRRLFAYTVGRQLDIDAMNEACQILIGEHDFASFASSVEIGLKSTVRKVYKALIDRSGESVIFNILANSFLPHQVRNTVGTLIKVGLGKMQFNEFCSIMEAKKIGLAGPAAPAHGLYLMQVNYPQPLGEGTE